MKPRNATPADSHAEEAIRALASQHGVTSERVFFDGWADQISALSGQDGESADEVEQLLINLLRNELIDPDEAFDLHASYMNTKYGFQ
jgi:hypothetical protein